MAASLRRRLASEEGFTLIELLVVVIILGILMAIAIPSYMHFKDRASTSAAEANVRSAVPALEAYATDHASGYTGASVAKLQASYDAGVKGITIISATTSTYCLHSTTAVKGNYYYKAGPGADITSGTSATTCA